jgi:hypothetical protein
MEIKFPPTDREILTDIQLVENKINYLKNLQQLQKISQVRIYFKAETDKGRDLFIDMDQSNVPFNLPTEIANLIDDSLDHYSRLRNNLYSFLKLNDGK